LTYTPSLALFAQSRHDAPRLAKGSPPAALVLGNPLFERPPLIQAAIARSPKPKPRRERDALCFTAHPSPLPLLGTQIEAERIAALYGRPALTGAAATEAALRREIEQADVIHLATHGCFHPPHAMSSGLLLALPEPEPESSETDNDGL